MSLYKLNIKKMATIILVLNIVGCASTSVRDKYTNENDICFSYRSELLKISDSSEKTTLHDTTVGAVIGGITGGAIGAGVGFFLNDPVTGAVIGATTGAALGGASAYSISKTKEDKIKNELLEKINNNMNSVSDVSKTINLLNDCRIEQYNEILEKFNNQSIKKDDALLIIREIDKLQEEDQNMITEIIGKINLKSDYYLKKISRISNISTKKISKITDSDLEENNSYQNTEVNISQNVENSFIENDTSVFPLNKKTTKIQRKKLIDYKVLIKKYLKLRTSTYTIKTIQIEGNLKYKKLANTLYQLDTPPAIKLNSFVPTQGNGM